MMIPKEERDDDESGKQNFNHRSAAASKGEKAEMQRRSFDEKIPWEQNTREIRKHREAMEGPTCKRPEKDHKLGVQESP